MRQGHLAQKLPLLPERCPNVSIILARASVLYMFWTASQPMSTRGQEMERNFVPIGRKKCPIDMTDPGLPDDQRIEAKAKRPEDNPWYLLATLYGQPTANDVELQERNSRAWNRYMARWLTAECRSHTGNAMLIRDFVVSPEDAAALEVAFIERCRQADSTVTTRLDDLQINQIDFSHIDFEDHLFLTSVFFPLMVNFTGAIFAKSTCLRAHCFVTVVFSKVQPS
jgi:hypothetical protein